VIHQATKALVPTASGEKKEYMPSAQLARRLPSAWPRPVWHAPWKNYRVVSGHLGCVLLWRVAATWMFAVHLPAPSMLLRWVALGLAACCSRWLCGHTHSVNQSAPRHRSSLATDGKRLMLCSSLASTLEIVHVSMCFPVQMGALCGGGHQQ
jgi:hypothetical protein